MVRFWSLKGVSDYSKVKALQLDLVEKRAKSEIPDTILFLEHQPVITRGSGLQGVSGKSEGTPKNVPIMQTLPDGITYQSCERGGDLTYHGPGQLVIYPIVKLDGSGFGPKHDVHGFLRRLEAVLVDFLDDLDVAAQAKSDATGVWVGDKKIASIGIAVKKWVVYHGAAINVTNDLRPFHLIVPCGFHPSVMTRVIDIDPEFEDRARGSWRNWMEERLVEKFLVPIGKQKLASGEIERVDLETLVPERRVETANSYENSEL